MQRATQHKTSSLFLWFDWELEGPTNLDQYRVRFIWFELACSLNFVGTRKSHRAAKPVVCSLSFEGTEKTYETIWSVVCPFHFVGTGKANETTRPVARSLHSVDGNWKVSQKRRNSSAFSPLELQSPTKASTSVVCSLGLEGTSMTYGTTVGCSYMFRCAFCTFNWDWKG